MHNPLLRIWFFTLDPFISLLSWLKMHKIVSELAREIANDAYGTTWRTRRRTTWETRWGATRRIRHAETCDTRQSGQTNAQVLVHYYIIFVLIHGIPFHSIPRSMFYMQPLSLHINCFYSRNVHICSYKLIKLHKIVKNRC